MTATNRSDLSPASGPSAVPQVPVLMDTKGRVRTTQEQRQAIVDEFERSGLSAPRFAQRAGINYSTLAGWLQRHRRAKPERGGRSVRLLEAVVESRAGLTAGELPLRLQLPGGLNVEVADARQAALAAALIRELARPC